MLRIVRHVTLGVALWLMAAGAGAVHARAVGSTPGGGGRQILVMLQLQREHYRAEGGFGGGYGAGASRVARRRIAERLAQTYGLMLVDNWPMPLAGVDCFIMAVPADRSLAETATALSGEREVSWAEPLQAYHTLGGAGPPNDPLWRLQPAADAWRLADMHRLAKGRGVKVAVIDSMIDSDHPDLKGQVESSQDFVVGHPSGPEMHGTAVAGVIAAIEDNGIGIAGIAPAARLMALRACWQDARGAGAMCDSLSLAKALHFAIDHKAQVINLSLGGPPDRLLEKLLDVAEARHMIVVAATDPTLAHGGFPASHPGVLAATDELTGGQEAGVYFAPGRDVPTTKPGGRWSMVNGSSFAAAHITGLVALMLERTPSMRRPITLVRLRGGGVDAYATLVDGVKLLP